MSRIKDMTKRAHRIINQYDDSGTADHEDAYECARDVLEMVLELEDRADQVEAQEERIQELKEWVSELGGEIV